MGTVGRACRQGSASKQALTRLTGALDSLPAVPAVPALTPIRSAHTRTHHAACCARRSLLMPPAAPIPLRSSPLRLSAGGACEVKGSLWQLAVDQVLVKLVDSATQVSPTRLPPTLPLPLFHPLPPPST